MMSTIVHKAILCLGSNVEAERNVNEAKKILAKKYPGLQSTPNLRTAPIGIQSEDFVNCMVRITLTESFESLLYFTKQLERNLGRNQCYDSKDRVTIDVDILLFDDQKLHRKDWDRPYVKLLLQELRGEKVTAI